MKIEVKDIKLKIYLIQILLKNMKNITTTPKKTKNPTKTEAKKAILPKLWPEFT